MRRLAVVVVVWLWALALAVPTAAGADASLTASLTVGAGHTLPSGTWGYSDGCQSGYSGSEEYRCAFEFDISSLPSTAKVISAVLSVRRSGGCATNDCPVDLASYTGDGAESTADVLAGFVISTFTPTSNNVRNFNVLGHIQAHAEAGHDWAGFRLSRNSASARNPDVQDWDISTADQVRLTIDYVAQPVDVQVYLAGAGEGANGSVTSEPAGIDCGTTCLWWFEYASPLTLTAEPASGATFGFWNGGPCDGSTNPVCEFIVPAENLETTANFYGIGPPISQPPGATPSPTAPILTPKPTARVTVVPGATDVPPTQPSSTDGGVTTPLPSTGATAPVTSGATLEPGATPGPTDAPTEPTSGGGSSPLVLVLLIAIAAIAVGGGAYYVIKRRQAAPPPGA